MVSKVIALLACGAALSAFVFLTLADSYHGQVCRIGGECESISRTLVEKNGTWVLALLAVPVTITAAGLAAAWLRLPRAVTRLCGGGVLLFCIVAIFSIGTFFLPAALLLLLAAGLHKKPRST